MTMNHHISEPMLMAYAAGTLPEAFNLVLATHLSLCDDCRAQLAACEAVGGALLQDAGSVAMDAGSFEACLARLARPTPAPRLAAKGLFPAPLRDYVGGDLSAVQWKPLGMGVRQAILTTDKLATARLLYIPAGHGVPDHGHRGIELTLVLQGAFSDSTSRFGPGDLEIANEDLDHTPVAEAGMDCICLAATDAPLRFSGLIPRLAQPFLRI
ncbi:ChrR family anti-sigma-E factor [Rhodobacter ferrooxidans]|uniref:Anti-ECFsigma factor, ChrR n=1 Tax=Rhodobacter ferrooxidans TaxID=371731 RepID=C8RXH2_9RHOB|nr:ChrR family anti-sigma-E factor [Rhodobacter sp. SW2]EEW26697.1 anti-ECFsigma factor, ChrR [Rhodobacter sp. SW2]